VGLQGLDRAKEEAAGAHQQGRQNEHCGVPRRAQRHVPRRGRQRFDEQTDPEKNALAAEPGKQAPIPGGTFLQSPPAAGGPENHQVPRLRQRDRRVPAAPTPHLPEQLHHDLRRIRPGPRRHHFRTGVLPPGEQTEPPGNQHSEVPPQTGPSQHKAGRAHQLHQTFFLTNRKQWNPESNRIIIYLLTEQMNHSL